MPQPPWKAWYNLKRWRDLRQHIFRRDLYTCQCGCGLMQGNTSLLVCDHIKPHRGDERLFWEETNLQTLLKSRHDSAKQSAEQASLNQRGVWY
jgi:5-methylcytosine-specific restriction protein A